MLNFTVRIGSGPRDRRVQVAGTLDVHNATEFSQMVGQLSQAVGTNASIDLSNLLVLDAAGWSAVRTFVRDAQEFGGAVTPPPVTAGA